jgi:hypothetical protein
MSKPKEILYIPECCQKCKESCKVESVVKEAEVFCCKKGSKKK